MSLSRCLASLLFTAAAVGASSSSHGRSSHDDALAAGFLSPPPEVRPRTFWLWMNGNVTRDGITRDLEAMQRVGIGGVMMFDGSTYLPAGPAGYLDPRWRSLMTHAIQEGNRLGIDIGMHNGPGWSSSGGPWIEPAMAMQQLVWTETTITGGQSIDVALVQPQTNLGTYRDAFTVAFPALDGEQGPYEDALARVTNGEDRTVPKAALSDGQWDTSVTLSAGQALRFEFAAPLDLYGLTVQPSPHGGFAPLQVEVSADGLTYRTVCTITNAGTHGIPAPAVRDFPVAHARFVRLVPKGDGEVAEVVFHRAPRLHDWAAKSNFDYRVAGQLTLPSPVAAGLAIDPAQVIDLSARVKDGRLRWDAPAGAWTIMRIGYTPTGKKNVAASAAGSGLETDKLNQAATEFHFNHVMPRIQADAAAVGAKGPVTLTIDSYEAGMQNWTPAFPEEFRHRAGYDLVKYLPALFGRIVGDPGVAERFLFDFRRTQADMMAEYYYGRMGELAHEHGMRFYVEGYGPGNFDELKVAGVPDVPMTEFWTRTPWTPNRSVKMVTSAAHVYGKSVVGAESFTGEAETSRWLNYPYALKSLGDDMFAQGVNQLVFHRYAHQPHPDAVPGMTMGPWGFHFDRTNTWFEQSVGWIDYLKRSQFLLRQGTAVADVLYFTGERPPDSSQYAIPVLPAGYTYDLVNADVLLHRVKVEDGAYVLPEGGRYRLLVLPENLRGMTPELMRQLAKFAAAGATIIGPKPSFSPTLSDYPASEQTMLRDAETAWKLPNVQPGLTIAEALRRQAVPSDFTITASAPDTSLSWQHRQIDGGDLYFVSNRQRRVEEIVASFRGMAGRQPEIWRPESGAMEVAALAGIDGGRLELPLRLEPAESVFVLFRRAAPKAMASELSRDGKPVIGRQVAPSAPPDAANNFTMAIWVKPDTNLRVMPTEGTTGRIDEVGKFYAIPADPGDVRFGAGHATAGLAVGRNGIFVIERSSETAPAVLVSPQPISGWTHIAVCYRDGVPELYVNGAFVRRGLRSGKVVHSGVGAPPPPVDYTLNFPGIEAITRAAGQEPPPSRGQVFAFEGNFAGEQVFDQALTKTQIAALAAAGLPDPVAPIVNQLNRRADGATEFLAWQSGAYALDGGGTQNVNVPAPETLVGPWHVAFQANRGAPPRITLPELESLHLHADSGVKYFSGTATYSHDWHMTAPLAPGQRVMLDLGRVEVVAEVKVNGRSAGLVWKEPYRLDITDLVKPGSNRMEIVVTNLWTNRLIGDESLPVEDEFGLRDERGVDPHGIVKLPGWYLQGKPKPPGGRVTFATWRFYDADEPLVASGLLGPVRIWQPVRVVLPESK